MTLDQVRALVTVPDEEMLPPPELFLHASFIHGPSHVGRVMIHALRLVETTGFVAEAPRLWAAVYLHDIARHGDGWERDHGPRAALRLRSLPHVLDRFQRAGVVESDLPAIREAVARHSRAEAMPGEPHVCLIQLLKDADGLDRVRINDLDPAYLRTPAAKSMVDFASQLYEETRGRTPAPAEHFAWLWREMQRILGSSTSSIPASPRPPSRTPAPR
jgi:uncharacterized protein